MRQILFPSGAYISYGRVTPQEVPRIVEETILEGKLVPGLLRNAVGVTRPEGKQTVEGRGILAW
jgi:(2Fe-2S) ferredoxin